MTTGCCYPLAPRFLNATVNVTDCWCCFSCPGNSVNDRDLWQTFFSPPPVIVLFDDHLRTPARRLSKKWATRAFSVDNCSWLKAARPNFQQLKWQSVDWMPDFSFLLKPKHTVCHFCKAEAFFYPPIIFGNFFFLGWGGGMQMAFTT